MSQYLEFYRLFYFKNLLSMFVGVLPRFWPNPFAAALFTDAIVVVAITASIYVVPRAWRAWAFFFISTSVSILPVAIARGGGGEFFPTEARASTEILPFMAIAIAYIVNEFDAGRVRGSLKGSSIAVTTRVSVVVTAIVAMVATAFSDVQYENQWASVAIAKRLRVSVDALTASSDHTLLEHSFPEGVVHPFAIGNPYGRLSRLVRFHRPDVSLSNLAARLVSVVQQDGSMRVYERVGESTSVGPPQLQVKGGGAVIDEACIHIDGLHPATFAIEVPAALKSAKAVMLGVDWSSESRPIWLTPFSVSADGVVSDQARLPTGDSQFPSDEVIELAEHTAQVGFEVPVGNQVCVKALRVVEMKPSSRAEP